MSATIQLLVCTGANAATETVATGIMLRSNDSAATDKSNPIVVPSAGTSRSYEKWIRWKCTVAPSTQCTNFKYWGPSTTPGTGLTLFAGTTATGAAPSNSDSSVATTQQDTNYYDSSHTLAVSGTLTGTNQKTDFVVLQMDVISTASAGDIAQQTHNYSYDEN